MDLVLLVLFDRQWLIDSRLSGLSNSPNLLQTFQTRRHAPPKHIQDQSTSIGLPNPATSLSSPRERRGCSWLSGMRCAACGVRRCRCLGIFATLRWTFVFKRAAAAFSQKYLERGLVPAPHQVPELLSSLTSVPRGKSCTVDRSSGLSLPVRA